MASAKKKASKPHPARRVLADWLGVSSIDVARDGGIVVGENGGYRAARFGADGALAWSVKLARAGGSSRYQYETFVVAAGDEVLALVDRSTIAVLDLASGKKVAEHVVDGARNVALSKDRTRLVVRVETETTVLAYPSFDVLAKFDQYCNQDAIAISPNGKWFAVCGDEVHVYDAVKLRHRKTFEPPESPWAMSASASGDALFTGDDKNMLRLYDADHDFTKLAEIGKNRSPTLTAIAVSDDGKWIATANDLGTINVFHAGTLALAYELKGHDPSQPDTGARSISALAFLPSGELVVSAPPKKEPRGLTVHTLSAG